MDKGAHFRRCDFQVHTPRDPNWAGAKPSSEADRRRYADEFVLACRTKGLNSVAITDHYDFAFVDFIREAAARETREDGSTIPNEERLVVFPGLELTLAVPCQALLILDADFPADRLSSVLERLSVEQADETLESHAPPDTLPHIKTLRDLYAELDRASWLRGHYIVLPNVTDGGHKTLMRKGMKDAYREMPCVGGYIDGDITKKVGDGNRRIFAGEDKAWGNKPLALFQTSDSRDEGFRNLGRHTTWVKWAQPTAEALRQACLSAPSRISQVEPALPSIAVTRLSVSNSRFMGPVELEFNQQYNAIIGGRGTGKSTCLEYLRWALCDQAPLVTVEDDASNQATRRRRLIENTLAPFDATVEVHFVLNGIPHVVRRHSKTGDLLLRVGSDELTPSTEENVRSLLPIDAYSQKQLSSVAVRADELARFVTAPIRAELDDLRTRSERIAGRLRENHANLMRARSLQRTIEKSAVAVTSIEEQAQNLRGSLGDVSDADREILASKPRMDAAEEQAQTMMEVLDDAASELDHTLSILGAYISEFGAPKDRAPSPAPLDDLEAAVYAALTTTSELVERGADTLAAERKRTGKIAAFMRTWEAMRSRYERAYEGAQERTSAHASRLEDLRDLEKRRKETARVLREERQELKRIGNPERRHLELRAEWMSLQRSSTRLVADQCVALTELSDGLIRARIRRSAGIESATDRFKRATSGSGIRAAKLESFFGRISAADDPLEAWQEAIAELDQRLFEMSEPQGQSDKPLAGALAVFSNADIARLLSKLTAEELLELSLTPIGDTPLFEYRVRDGDYIEFDVASAGQQATALLRVLLNQSGPPLVIDQPEDDLDSQVVEDVVDRIWTAKTRRQIIFSSHNANLVVNGDAELVVCCDYRTAHDQSGGRIKLEGAIDIPSVREEITVVMEGGEKAFKLRKDKYGF